MSPTTISRGLLTLVVASALLIVVDAGCYPYSCRDKNTAGFIHHLSSPRVPSPASRSSIQPSPPSALEEPSVLRSLLYSRLLSTSLPLGTNEDTSDEEIIIISSTSVASSSSPKSSSHSDLVNATTTSPVKVEELAHDDTYYDQMFDSITQHSSDERSSSDEEVEGEGHRVKLVDFIEQHVGIKRPGDDDEGDKIIRGRPKMKETDVVTGAFTVEGKEKIIKVKGELKEEGKVNEEEDSVSEAVGSHNIPLPISAAEANLDYTASNEFTMASEIAHLPTNSNSSSIATRRTHDSPTCTTAAIMEEQPPPSVRENKEAPYNVVCTHITADFDTLASAIGLAKLWSCGIYDEDIEEGEKDNVVNGPLPTYVVLPRGAHPDVQRFLSLHKHLFPIRSLKSLPGFTDNDHKKGKNESNSNPNEGLQRVGLVDAQRRDRLGPAEILLAQAKLGVTIVDHHVDAESDIQETTKYIVQNVGSVSTMIAERMKKKGVELSEAEATALALGIHSDTGSLVYDSTVCVFAVCFCPLEGVLFPFVLSHAL